MGLANGGDLNAARGKIEIDTSQAEQAPGKMQGVATGINQAMSQVSAGATNAAQGIGIMASAVRGLSATLGIGFGAQGIAQLAKMAVDATALATAFNRQKVAAEGLAGSQAKLNEMLVAYGRATGGAVDDATALTNVTQLMAVGFADSVPELEKFATVIRGISVAMGQSQGMVTQNLILELFTQRGARLDQLGLQYEKVKQRADELAAADSSLSAKQAYQNAVLEQATERYGDLAKSAQGAATGMEVLGKEAGNANLEIGKLLATPINAAGFLSAAWIQQQINLLHGWERAAQDLFAALQRLGGGQVATGMQQRFIADSAGRDAGRHSSGSGAPATLGPTAEQQDAMKEWYQRGRDITKQSLQDINDEESEFGRQRADIIANYNKDISRGAEDFARQQTQAEQNLQDSIADVQADGARRQLQMAIDLQRTIAAAQRDSTDRLADLQENLDRTLGERRADSADRIAEMEDERDKSIAEKKADSAKRILEIEQNYNEQRIRSEAQYHLNRTQAAERLDGRALFDLEAQHKIESQQALDSKDKQIADEKSKLDEALRKVNESYAERLGDEQKALAKSIKQANEAHNRQVKDEKDALAKRIENANTAYGIQLADGITADNTRIEDLKTAYGKEKEQANTEYGLRLARQAQDHTDQLTALDTAHDLRIAQIGAHAAAERTALDNEFTATLTALGLHVGNYITEQDKISAAAEKAWDAFMKHVNGTLTTAIGPVENPAIPLPSMNPRSTLQSSINQWMIDQAKTDDPAEKKRLQDLIDGAQGELDKLGPAAVAMVSGAAFNMPKASAFAPMPAMASGAMMGGSNRSLSVGDINVTVNAVSGDTANSIMDVIDKRILHQIQVAAGRL